MPGIVGFISKAPRERAELRLRSMVEAIRHESFYEVGTWIEESAGLYVGWAIPKNSFAGGMPVHNETGDITLVFSGQEYSPDIARQLREQGHAVSDGSAAYLAHWYEQDPNFPAGLNGLFHGVLFDRKKQSAVLFNDRYGMHRLCYHQSKDGLYFAAEAKAILAVFPGLRELDVKSLGEFLACSCVLEDRTLFRGIQVMPAGSAWVLQDGGAQKKVTYFSPEEWENQPLLNSEAYYQQLRDVLAKNLSAYFGGKEQVGVALTGGMDTRVIMAWHRAAEGTLPCYTFGGMFRDCRDVQMARQVARQCKQSHQVIELGEEFLKRFPYYAERTTYLTEGGVDVYRAPDLFASEKARKIAPAKIVGTYGSEVVRHAVMFKPIMPAEGLFEHEFMKQVEDARRTYLTFRTQHPVTFAAFRQSPWYHRGVLALEQTQLSVRSPFLDNEFVRTVYQAPNDSVTNGDVRLRLIKDGDAELAKLPSDRAVGGDLNPFTAPILRVVSEFTFKAEYAYDYGMPQWAARVDHFLSPLQLQRLFLGRHKFSHFRVWYRDWLAGYIQQILLDSKALSRPYVQGKTMAEMVQMHVKGTRNYTSSIHKLLAMELLQRQFFDGR
jgi:asparagine synthase (glutamine-hydrolysing)